MIRPNVPMGWDGYVHFVGGLGVTYEGGKDDLEQVIRGEQRGEPRLFGGEWWIQVHVPGFAGELLVPMENVRPYGQPTARVPQSGLPLSEAERIEAQG